MKFKYIYLVSILILFSSCGEDHPQLQNKEEKRIRHIFYMHGRIIEEQGKDAYSEKFGKYELDSIVSSLRVDNSIVHCEVRRENVESIDYARFVSKQVDSLINSGVKPIDISIVGASKGAIIAANISTLNQHPINYVLIAGNNNYQEENNDWKFHGQVLCIYDLSDSIAGKHYDYWEHKDNSTARFKQLEIRTNLGHGFLYKPMEIWMKPTKKWILIQDY